MFSLRDCITRCQRDLTPDTSDLMALHVLPSGVFGKECSTFIEMLNDFGFQKQHQNYCMNDDDCNPNNVLYILLSKQGLDQSGTVNCLNVVLSFCYLNSYFVYIISDLSSQL
jgi:hypothetical protein